MDKKDTPQKVLLLSDIHIGARSSNFPAYQEKIIELMTQYDHVAMIGDCWELFFIDKDHVKPLSKLLEVLTGKDSKVWTKKFNDEGTKRSGVENVIHGAKWFTEEFLDRFPNVHLHFIAGNHESVRRFHNEFEALQKHHPNFEWSPEAVRIGDALITHGHLPMYGKTQSQFPMARLRDAEREGRWTGLVQFFSPIEHGVQVHKGKDRTSRTVEQKLTEWSKTGDFLVSHNGKHEPLKMDWVKHIFFGHTHVKFDNYKREEGDILFHNPGAIVQLTSKKPEDLGILEADLNADGTITNVQPVNIMKDRKIFRVSGAPDSSVAR